MKIETKFNVGDKVLYDGRVYTITQAGWTSDRTMPWYTLDSNKDCRHTNEDQLLPAPRYAVGDKVWALVYSHCYQMKVIGTDKNSSDYILEHPVIKQVFRQVSEFHSTKEALLASIPCHELP